MMTRLSNEEVLWSHLPIATNQTGGESTALSQKIEQIRAIFWMTVVLLLIASVLALRLHPYGVALSAVCIMLILPLNVWREETSSRIFYAGVGYLLTLNRLALVSADGSEELDSLIFRNINFSALTVYRRAERLSLQHVKDFCAAIKNWM